MTRSTLAWEKYRMWRPFLYTSGSKCQTNEHITPVLLFVTALAFPEKTKNYELFMLAVFGLFFFFLFCTNSQYAPETFKFWNLQKWASLSLRCGSVALSGFSAHSAYEHSRSPPSLNCSCLYNLTAPYMMRQLSSPTNCCHKAHFCQIPSLLR